VIAHQDGIAVISGLPDDDTRVKEDWVREEVTFPLLIRLGYSSTTGANRIVRSRPLAHPFVMIGTTRKPITLIPDYLLSIGDKYGWVLDAKAPGEEILSGPHVEQIYSYAIHPEIRAHTFVLCNGEYLAIYSIHDPAPLLYCRVRNLEENWRKILSHLAPRVFRRTSSPASREVALSESPQAQFDYRAVTPVAEIMGFQKQAAKRHHGVHGYFTRQVWSVVQHYIENFTKPGDLILDPFGGSGVTLIEALILQRRAIHIDINPLSQFIVETLIGDVDLQLFGEEFFTVLREFDQLRPHTEDEVTKTLAEHSYPTGITLPHDSDVPTIEKLFDRKQLAELALLRSLILSVADRPCRQHLLLMFSGLLNKINLTYHASAGRTEGRGDSAVFRYYRYRIARESPRLDVAKVFKSRFKRVLAAKEELRPFVSRVSLSDYPVLQGTATDLSGMDNESIDYIYTDPPYGSKIPYLDLSVMWNAWLDIMPTNADYINEAIEGGEKKKTKGRYSVLLADSIREMYRVLKFDRWMSFVFAHKDPAYWHLIVGAAEAAGFEYAGVVKQNNGQTSFKKRQNPFTVLSGQLIINFKKVRNPRTIMAVDLGLDIVDVIEETIESVIVVNSGATIEQINDGLVIRGLELGFLHTLSQKYQDITPLLQQKFDYDETVGTYNIRRNSKIKAHIDVRLRVRYFLLSYMRAMEHLKLHPKFDEIVLSVMPLLKNGITPEEQTILNVLETLATRDVEGRWRLSDGPQGRLNLGRD
jgi:16S rRNA G966 N2-methylase RsmD